ncbi:50S ribosomal protein L29 [Solemya velesiana gill symbiont]|uniref:Large ribosomal subunit protein uL29 n=1 Tax=Solemya velesiana gill symbiont TaxID=1918948 RepID=A0A1T2KV10_9GAMM|nr:50S ribosomal protein L29 [Solemya velesiana gill symbiont]OOZ36664.1 50S ribosomal protein L29 [Solemya velesiana gill symbiont]
MKVSELREKNPAELEESLLDLRKEQFNLRMQQGTGQLARPSEMNRVRKEIARIKTVLNEQKAGEA